MVEVKLGGKVLEPGYTVLVYEVSDAEFDQLIPDDVRAELINRTMFVHSYVSVDHDATGEFMRSLINAFAEKKRLGRAYGPRCQFSPEPGFRFAPDAFFLRRSRVPRRLPAIFDGVPDLTVDLLPDAHVRGTMATKLNWYCAFRIPEAWFLDTLNKQVLVYREGSRNYETHTTGRVRSSVLEGFWIEPEWLCQQDTPNTRDCLERILAD